MQPGHLPGFHSTEKRILLGGVASPGFSALTAVSIETLEMFHSVPYVRSVERHSAVVRAYSSCLGATVCSQHPCGGS